MGLKKNFELLWICLPFVLFEMGIVWKRQEFKQRGDNSPMQGKGQQRDKWNMYEV